MQRNRVSNLEPGKLPWLVDEVLDEVKQEQDTETRQSISGIGEETETAETVNANQTRVDLVDQLGILISFAQEAGDTEMVSWLMERRHRLRTAGAVQDIGGVQTAAVPSADAVQGTDESQFASGNPEISGEPQRPKRKRRFEL